MTRRLRPEDARLWALVTATIRPGHGRETAPAVEPVAPAPERKRNPKPAVMLAQPPPRRPLSPPEAIEPRRLRRLAREHDPVGRRLDLHGLNQDAARVALHGFVRQASAEGCRAVLVITGKGVLGEGLLRRRTPEWLAEPPVRDLVAGIAEAHHRHGGQGALYVALKRRHPI